VGELGATGVAAAIANAVFQATGKRIGDLSITPEKLIA
jgi:xanthine dehydrogenase YagR molybdenum-binding subunit